MKNMTPTFFASPDLFRVWLERNSTAAEELVVGFWKVDSGRPCMSWSQSVDEALCFRWIDGVRKWIDDRSYQIRFTPRKSGSIWSAVNIAKFTKLQEAGRMTKAGEAAFSRRTDQKSAVYAYEQSTTAELAPHEVRLILVVGSDRFTEETPRLDAYPIEFVPFFSNGSKIAIHN